VFRESPVSGYEVTLLPTEAICAKFEQLLPVQRSIKKPFSFVELSVHDRLICDDETDVADRLLGAFGAGFGVGVGVGVGVGAGVGVGVGVLGGVGVGVGDGAPPHPGNLNEPIRVRQLKLLVVG
jgi:hypothetical protein